jgi:hypothetical protein
MHVVMSLSVDRVLTIFVAVLRLFRPPWCVFGFCCKLTCCINYYYLRYVHYYVCCFGFPYLRSALLCCVPVPGVT